MWTVCFILLAILLVPGLLMTWSLCQSAAVGDEIASRLVKSYTASQATERED